MKFKQFNVGRLTFIDQLRGIACLMVVMCHLNGLFTYYGALGVEIFFVLSGFIIPYSVRKIDITNVKLLYVFLVRRFVRLAPPYYASIFITFLIYSAQNIFLKNHHIVLPSPLDILASIFFLQFILNFEPINPVYWTICIESQFYVFFGLLLLFCKKIFILCKIKNIEFYIYQFTFFVSLLLYYKNYVANISSEHSAIFVSYWIMFGIGIMSFWSFSNKISYRYVVTVFLLLLVLSVFWKNIELVTATLTGFFIVLCTYREKLADWLNFPLTQFFGKISYSLYLIHFPVIVVMTNFFHKIDGKKTIFEALFDFVVMFITFTTLSAILYYTVEIPATKLASTLSSSVMDSKTLQKK